MSIFEDKELLRKLMNAGLHFNKIAQSLDNDSLSNGKKLVTNLLSNFEGNPTIFADTDSKLKSADLENLGTFLKFLSDNKVTINGQRIVYGPNDKPPTSLDPNKYLTYSDSRNTASGTIDTRYTADKPALISYVNYLKSKTKGNDVFRVMLDNIITEINSRGGNIELTTSKETKTSGSLNQNDVLDGFNGSDIANERYANPDNFNTSSIKLLVSDLASKESLSSWAKKNNIQIDKFNFGSNNFDYCKFCRILYSRANSMKNSATESTKKSIEYYIKRISEILPQFTDASGKSCKINDAETSNTQSSGYISEDKESENEKSNGNVAPNLHRIIATLPLNEDYIDFNEIKKFLANFINLKGQNEYTNKTYQILNSLNNYMDTTSMVNINVNPGNFLISLKPPKNLNYVNAIDLLSALLDAVSSLIMIIRNEYFNPSKMDQRSKEHFTQNEVNYIYSQVGSGTGDSSTYSRNINMLNRLRANANNVARIR